MQVGLKTVELIQATSEPEGCSFTQTSQQARYQRIYSMRHINQIGEIIQQMR